MPRLSSLLPFLLAALALAGCDSAEVDEPDPATCTEVELAEHITSNITLDGCYTVPAGFDLQVRDGALLTIMPGTRIEFGADARLWVTENAALTADGTAEAPIVLTGVQQTPGFWDGLYVYSNDARNVMDHVTVTYGGGTPGFDFNEGANVGVHNEARLTLTRSTLRHSGGYGLVVKHSREVANPIPGFADNVITDNAEASVRLAHPQIGTLDEGTVYAPNGRDVVEVYRAGGYDVTRDAHVRDIGMPYRLIGGDLQVRNGALLTLDPGVDVVMTQDAGIWVREGAFSAQGTAASPITFIGESPTPGYGERILFTTNDVRNVMDHVEAAYGGGDSAPNTGIIEIEPQGRLTLTNSTIRDSADWGVWLQRNDVTFIESGNTYTGNASGGVGQP